MRSPADQRIAELFLAAAGMSEPERRALLDSLPPADAGVRAGVERLLEADRRNADGFLLSPPPRPPETGGGGADPAPSDPLPHLGRYRALSVLGESEHSIVYLAHDDGPDRRTVALKLLRRRTGPSEVMRRFEQERRIIAMMDHPNIARLFGTGAAPDGRSYLVMEHVPGEPITALARSLPLRERLAAFARACQGVEHAHQRGIIHRDLKPGNILASPDGAAVKVIDFGIAKAIGSDHLAPLTLTREGHVVGTPAYMSPEQVRGESALIDTRSDVYALGAVLYELLTGAPMIETSGAGPVTLISRILDEEPRRPEALNPALAGDLSTIIRTAAAKEPHRRYPSVAELRADVERFLAGRPIVARRPSTLYIVRKFAGRHRALVAVSSLALAVAAVAGHQAWKARTEQFDKVLETTQSWFGLVRDMARTFENHGRREDVIALMVAQSSGLLAQDPRHPGFLRLHADALAAQGDLELELGRTARAGELFDQVLAIRERLVEADPRSLDDRAGLSIAHVRIGDLAAETEDRPAAVARYLHAMSLDEQTLAMHPGEARALTVMIWSCHRMASVVWGDLDHRAAIALHNRALGLIERLLAVEYSADALRALCSTHSQLSGIVRQVGAPEEAQAHLDRAVAAAREAARIGPEDRLAQLGLVDMRMAELDLSIERPPPGEGLARALGILGEARRLVALNPSDRIARRSLAYSLTQASQWSQRAGELDVALALAREAVAEAAWVIDRQPGDPEAQNAQAGAKAQLEALGALR